MYELFYASRSGWNVWSLLDAHSRSSIAATRFSANTARIPEGTAAGIPIQLIEPFDTCTPALL